MGLFDKQSSGTKRNGLFGGGDSFDTTSLDKQISNANTRIADSGYKTEDADQRNWFEKATNLPKGQNWFFDTLELLGRPGGAVKNVIDKNVINGTEGLGEAAWKGFSGQEKVHGSHLAEDLGVENKVGKFALGLGLDIALDPLTYVPGGVLLKGAKGAANLAAAPVKFGYNALENASKPLQTFRTNVVEPALTKTKDALGHAFVPQYKWDQTLTGASDDTVKNLFNQTNNNIRFQSEESLKNIGNVAKTTGLQAGDDVGRLMEKDLQVFGPRPARQYSNDPKVQQAAQNLMKSNDDIRQWATDSGVDVGQLQGYMAHILSAEERALRPKKINVDRGTQGNNPDKKILNARTLQGSAEDVNQQVGRKFFEPNAYFSTAIGQKRLVQYANAVKFRREVLGNPEFAQPFTKGMRVTDDAAVINTNNYQFIKDPLGQLPDEVGGEYLVTKGVKAALDRYQHAASDEGTKGFLKAYDTLQSLWKRGALFSLGYHARNQAGAMFNNYVGGMNPADLVKYTKDGFREVTEAVKGKESAMFKEYRQQGLSSNSLSQVEFAKFGEDPEKAIERTVKNLSRDKKGQVTQRLNPKNAFQTSQEVGNYFDQANRFGLYKWARDKGMSSEEAAKKVREVQFDYSNTTPFESNVVSRVIPFYRWMRNNIPFQVRQAINDPRKYEYINKARLNAQEVVGLNDENIPDYMKESFAIPITGENGKGKMLGLNLPLGDLTKLSRPGKTLVDSTSVLLKTPAELALNYNTFLRKPIEKFAGQEKKYQIPFTDKGFGIDSKTAYALEQATGQIGRGLSGFLQKPESADQDTLNRLPTLGISSLSKDFDAEKYAYYKKLDELKKMQDLMLYIQQQEGSKPRTLNEIKKAR